MYNITENKKIGLNFIFSIIKLFYVIRLMVSIKYDLNYSSIILIILSHFCLFVQFNLSYLELLCLYGYSLSIFVPISILWVIQVNWLQWLLVAAGTLVSGYVIVSSIVPSLGQKPFSYIFLITILHLFMGTGFMLYFFHVPPIQKS